jgi:hypothetical protein
MASVRIVDTPPGEAPLEIRRAWVGLELPVLGNRPVRYLGSGVLTGPKSFTETLFHLITLRLVVQSGYVVPAERAIEILEAARPEAARWWREHAAHTIRAGRKFLFSPECCEFVK